MTSALAEPPGCVCSACLGTPAVVPLSVLQLAALLGFPCWLTQVGCSTPAVLVSHGVGGCLVTVVLFPPLFSFLCLRSFPFRCFPFGVLPPSRVGWHVCLQFAGLLFGVVGGVLLRLFPQCLCAVFPAAGTWGFSGLLCSLTCWGGWGFAPCVRVFRLRCCLLGLQVGFPCCLFLTLEWVYFWLRCLQCLWATKAVSAALRGSSSSSGVCWSISFFWSWGGFWSRVVGSSCDSWFWSSDARSHIPDAFASSSTPICGSWMVLAPGFSCALPWVRPSRFPCWLLARDN